MTLEIALLFALIAAALACFVREWLPIEVTALALLALLLVTGLVDPADAFAGFSNPAVIAIGSLFVLSHALSRSGVLEPAIEALGRLVDRRQGLGLGVLLGGVGLLSGVLNNTAVVAMTIPVAVTLSERAGLSPSKILMPLSYVSILGGTLTLIGTSTNLLVSSLLAESGRPPIGMFEVTALGAIFLAVGLVYIFAFAPRVLPDRPGGGLTGRYGLGKYLSEVRILDESELIGRPAEEAGLAAHHGIQLLAILREGRRVRGDVSRQALHAGDVLIVESTPDDLLAARDQLAVALLPDMKLGDEELREEGLVIVEAIVPPTSALVGRTLAEFDFHRRFTAFVLAVRRQRSTLRQKVARLPLQAGDALLVVVSQARLGLLSGSPDLVVVSPEARSFHRPRAWWLVVAVLPLAVVLAAAGVVPIAVGALLAAVALLVAGALTPQQAYRSVNWSVIFLIAAFVPVGRAIVDTGAARLIADGFLGVARLFPDALIPWTTLSLLYLVTSLMTETVSNSATAIILTPVALSLGAELGVDPRPFVIAICFAASASFMTPMGYQTNLMVHGPGSYRFTDYLRLGAPLNALGWILGTLLIPVLWPF